MNLPPRCLPIVLIAAALLGLVGTARAQGADVCQSSADDIPARSAQAPNAHSFAAAAWQMSDAERDAATLHELLLGNMPAFLRRLRAVTVNARTADSTPMRITLCVMPDYLSVGEDNDFVRVPMALGSALAVAQRFGFTLPTRRIVDLIYAHAGLRLNPQPLPPGERMRSMDYVVQHQGLIEHQRVESSAPLGLLTAGHKKDLVLTPRLLSDPAKVAIYGWHRLPGVPIQPLSTVHGARYADYSHGVRLISQRVLVNGVARSIFDVLADASLAPLLSDEGSLPKLF